VVVEFVVAEGVVVIVVAEVVAELAVAEGVVEVVVVEGVVDVVVGLHFELVQVLEPHFHERSWQKAKFRSTKPRMQAAGAALVEILSVFCFGQV
jgi:hypothetical protein